MKTYPRFSSQTLVNLISLLILLVVLFALNTASAQNNISFTNYKLISGAAGQKGATYRFSAVTQDAHGAPAADCIVKIESMSPGVRLKQLNHDAKGNISSFQPEVEYMNINGPSWIEFSFTFVPHNNNQMTLHNLSEITTSVSGLNNYGIAQEFAECNLGPDSKVVYDNEITNLMISATGNGFRAENKWGGQQKTKNTEKLSIINKNVSEIHIKIGINRASNNIWGGTSTYRIELKDANPDMATVYMPDIVGFQARMQQDQIQLAWSSPNQDNLQDIVVEKSVDGEIFREAGRFRKTDMQRNGLYEFTEDARMASTMGAVFYRLRSRNMNGDIKYSSVKMIALNKQEDFVKTEMSMDPNTGAPVFLTPLGWQQKEVTAEVFNAQGDLMKRVSDKKALPQMSLEMKELAAGAYVVRFTCGKQYSTQYIIHTESL